MAAAAYGPSEGPGRDVGKAAVDGMEEDAQCRVPNCKVWFSQGCICGDPPCQWWGTGNAKNCLCGGHHTVQRTKLSNLSDFELLHREYWVPFPTTPGKSNLS